MINRIFKTILVLSIVLGITLPSNAAVSVSDGSAFVTKAEFAADLNNLSNRMAQLENSLDAKIDSLVSSYLTRNGIWNGQQVDIDRTITQVAYTGFVQSWDEKAEINHLVWSKMSQPISKTGLCVTVIHCEGSKGSYTGTGYRCYLRYTGGTWTGFEDDVRVVLSFSEVVNGTSYVRNSTQLGTSQQRTTDEKHQDHGECVCQLPINNDYVLLGFVSKDSSLNFYIRQLVSDFSLGSSRIDIYNGIVGGASWNVNIVSCDIY